MSFSKPFRRSYAGMVAGLASTVGLAQAMLLKATYQSPPDARGPRQGVERPLARGSFPNLGGPALTFSASQGTVTRIATTDGARAAADAIAVAEETPLKVKVPRRERKILVIGDSLVSGVGGSASFKNTAPDGPALPRHVARKLSELLDTDVHWNALSLTGGDVRMLRKKVIPMLKRERERADTETDVDGERVHLFSAIVLVTGFNDMKRISPVRTAKKFRDDLQTFIELIREEVGEDCDVFLPSIPGVHHTPRFHEPLRSILIFLNNLWDAQKIALSRCMRNVHFVGNPPEEAWNPNPRVFFSSLDRIHPSELGYKHWGYRIAKEVAKAFRSSVEFASVSASKISDAATDAVNKVGVAASSAAAAVKSKSNRQVIPAPSGEQ